MQNKGKYCIYEGADLTGKSTIAAMTQKWLHEIGIESIVAPQPGATDLGQKLREILKHNKEIELGKETEAMMFALDHMAFVENILERALKNGNWVLSDRCDYISGLIYQGLRGVQLSKLDLFYASIPTPKADCIFIMHATTDTIAERKSKRDAKWDRYESFPEFMLKVNDAYSNLVCDHYGRLSGMLREDGDLIEIDANKSIQEVFSIVTDTLKKKISNNKTHP